MASAAGKTVLYSYWRSSCSWRVRIALNLKEIPYEIKPVSLIKAGGEQHSNEYREVNPMEQVPALFIDGVTLIESNSIMHYLEETRTHSRPLLPGDIVKRAKYFLGSCAGKYCVGDEITLADCCLIPQVFNARRFHVDLRPFPIILRIDRELETHPAFLAAHPSNQPDCPPEAHK
ncbi:probable maleylacetoacetate isomerase 2 [Sitophilus oryzae]|uniref:maleylacetoacetate isomerase n=1 Tax=Sitophilus oryzae TaxID=7048 RepID=A0A6J2YN78_SITOR|nr:probable maleylacetoacetate isomerase 2 [Sitophilus oryzae]